MNVGYYKLSPRDKYFLQSDNSLGTRSFDA